VAGEVAGFVGVCSELVDAWAGLFVVFVVL